MSYRVGIGAGMAALGFAPREPHIECDGCGLRWNIPTDRAPPVWFLDGKAPKGWKRVDAIGETDQMERRDYCPRCKAGKGE
jgi:hypothetical protein